MKSSSQNNCPCCGGIIDISPKITLPRCPACKRAFTRKALEALRNEKMALKEASETPVSFAETQKGREFAENEIKFYRCQSCGGKWYKTGGRDITDCPCCCGTLFPAEGNGIPCPDYVIPFRVDKDDAIAEYKQRISQMHFLPDPLLQDAYPDSFEAIYVPFWLYEADAAATMYFRGNTVHNRFDDGFLVEEMRDYYSLFRKGSMKFSRVPVLGVDHLPMEILEAAEPFDGEGMEEFQISRLRGASVLKTAENAAGAIGKAQEIIRDSVAEAFRGTADTYSEVQSKAQQVQIDQMRAELVLCPVWVLRTRWKEKQYTFAVNGRNGKCAGEFPFDEKKEKKHFWKWFLPVSGIALAALLCLWGVLFL